MKTFLSRFFKTTIHQQTTLLAGDARSGTTWLMQQLGKGYPYRLVFEPFHPKHVPVAEQFVRDCFFESIEAAPSLQSFFDEVLLGKIHNAWVDQVLTPCPRNAPLLVKCIRVNTLLPWIQAHYSTLPIIFLLRHPIAVALSKTKFGWGTPLLEAQMKHPGIQAHFPMLSTMRLPEDMFEQNILAWCIKHALPMRLLNLQAPNLRIIHYEDAVIDPRNTITSLLPLLPPDFNLSKALDSISEPSATNASWSPTEDFSTTLTRWKDEVTSDQKALTDHYLKLFDLQYLYPR